MIVADAHDVLVSCIFLQELPDETRTSAGYFSGLNTKAEESYNTTQLGYIAIRRRILLLRPYLKSRVLFISRLRFLELDYDAFHPAGVKHQVADTLSRLTTNESNKNHSKKSFHYFLLILLATICTVVHCTCWKTFQVQ